MAAHQGVVYDAIVVGAGIEGSSTAYQLAKRGQNTLLLEQFPLPHSRGSSHGQSRITRLAYPQEVYCPMMVDAFRSWKVLEDECGERIYNNCGALYLSPPASLETVESGLKRNNGRYRYLTLDDVNRDFPQFSLPKDFVGIYDYQGGFLYADKCLRAFQNQFKQNGGVILDGEQVVDIIPGETVTLRTEGGKMYQSKSIVLALGPYTNILLAKLGMQLPLSTIRISVFYWKEKVAGMHSDDKFPCFLDPDGSQGASIYSIPAAEYPGLVKVCLHTGPVIDPHRREDVDSGWVRDRMVKYVTDRLPWLHNVPAIEESCIYTMSPDADLILDKHPKYNNIIIAAGFSGHGFKLAPVVGKVLSDMVMGNKSPFDLEPFKISRFNNSTKRLTARL